MPKFIIISKKKLEDLYTHKKLSSYQIAKKLRCSQNTIMERLERFKIKTRTIQEGKALTKPRFARKDFDGSKDDKSYLIGFRLGDLHISKTHQNSPTIRVDTNTTRKEQVTLMNRLFGTYGHVNMSPKDKNGAVHVRCFINTSFSFLVPKSDKIENWILRTKKYSFAFLAGYIDAEGFLGVNNRNQPYFGIKSQDKEIIKAIQSKILPMMNIGTKFHFIRPAGSIMNKIMCNKDVFGVFIYNRKDLKRILTILMPLLKHPKRRKDALRVSNLINKNVRS